MRKPGSVAPTIYFRNATDPAHPPGYLMLAPYSEFATPTGYQRCEADTLAAVDKLQDELLAQTYRERHDEWERDESRFAVERDAIRDRLYSRMTSTATTEWERDFIRGYLQLRADKRDKYRQRYLEYTAYIYAREMDLGSRAADSEEFHPDRIDVRTT